MKTVLGSLVLLLSLAGVSLADCYYPSYQTYYRQNVVVVEPLVAAFVPLQVPLYSVTYSDQSQFHANRIAELEDKIRKLESGPRRTAEAPHDDVAPPATEGMQVLNKQCASCHEKTVAATKGGKFAFLDGGQFIPIDEIKARKMLVRCMIGTMPPTKPLSDPEKKAVAALFDSPK